METLPVAPQFGEPAGGFEAKGDRQALLAMCSPSHNCIAVAAA
jgi:hypothetical protein